MKPDRGMDWLNMLVSGMGAAYGAFIPVYLTTHAWTQTSIGLVLTVSTVASMLCQVPAGVFVDTIGPRRRSVLFWAIVATGIVPVVFVVLPRGLPIMLAMILQAAAGSLLTPAIAAISLALVGREGLGERVGRNGRYGSIGAGLGAAIMGACGYLGSQRLAFVVAAGLTLPALLAARAIGPDAAAVAHSDERQPGLLAPFRLLRDHRLLIFALCVALFQVASIAVLQLSAVDVTARLGARGALVIAAFLIVPQLVVAVMSPWIGRAADRWGHRPALLAGFRDRADSRRVLRRGAKSVRAGANPGAGGSGRGHLRRDDAVGRGGSDGRQTDVHDVSQFARVGGWSGYRGQHRLWRGGRRIGSGGMPRSGCWRSRALPRWRWSRWRCRKHAISRGRERRRDPVRRRPGGHKTVSIAETRESVRA